MDILDYQQFEHCREKNLLSRGKKAFLQYVQVARQKGESSQQFKKNIEVLAYVLRFIIKTCVELSILKSHQTEIFDQSKTPISLSKYEASMGLIKDTITTKIQNFNRNLAASKAYLKEIRKNTPNKNIHQQVEIIKSQWKNMPI